MNEQHFRNKIHIFSTVLSILVIWVHSVNVDLFFPSEPPVYIDFIQTKIIAVGQIAVPGFFILSAYLFFRNLNEQNFPKKIQRRCISLVLPFFVWNTVYYLAYVLASRVPYLSDIIGKGVIPFEWNDAVDAIFFYKYNFVFWFVFQLILLILLTPVFHVLFRKKSVGILFLLFSLGYLLFDVRILFLNADALFYFALGVFLSRFHRSKTEMELHPKRLLISLGFAVLSYCAVRMYLAYSFPILAVISRSFGVTALWLCLIVPKNVRLPSLFRNSFFVYAIHFLIVRLVNKLFAHLYPEHALLSVGLFLCMPFFILILSDLLASILKKYAGDFYHILSGNR